MLSIYFNRSYQLRLAGALCAAAISAKISMVIALPFFLVYLYNSRPLRLRLAEFVTGFLMAGEIPSSRLKKERIQKLKKLIHSGVQSIVNLMESEEFDFNGKKLVDYSLELQEIANINKVEITINRFEIVDLGIPERAFMADILTHIQTCLLNEQTLYIHCWGGIGRTGTTVGCFLVNEGICSNSEVLDFINFLKRNTNIALRNSPETLEQMAFIENWQ
jgi:hypothetical protein